MSKVVLITGATGKQGGEVINNLLASPASSDFTILAVTRNESSASATALAKKSSNIKLVQGNLDDCEAIFATAAKATSQPIWGVYSVQLAIGDGANPEKEERQGKALVDAAVAHNVRHFVYSSVDRHGQKSSSNPTYVPHFISKQHVEDHLKEKAAGKMTYTILRPTAFMEMMTPDFQGKIMFTAWKYQFPTKPFQMISTADIGYFAAQALLKPEEYKNRELSLAGDTLTFEQGNAVFKEKTGQDAAVTFGFLVSAIAWAVKDFGLMFKWFGDEGFDADVPELKRLHPGLLSFGDFLEKRSKFETK